MYILPVFKELFETNRRFTLTVDSSVRDSDVRDFDVRDFDVRDCSKQLRSLRHCRDIPLPPYHAVCTEG